MSAALIPPCITYFSQLEKPIAFVITLWTCAAQRSTFSEAAESHSGKRWKSLTEAKVDQTVWGENRFTKETTTLVIITPRNTVQTTYWWLNWTVLRWVDVSAKGEMQLSRWPWWIITVFPQLSTLKTGTQCYRWSNQTVSMSVSGCLKHYILIMQISKCDVYSTNNSEENMK